MKKILTSIVAAFALPMLAACGDGAANPVGTYELDRTALKDAAIAEMGTEAKGSKEALTMVEQMLPSISMELKADGTVAATMTAMGSTHTDTGTWKLDGGKLILTTKGKGKDDSKIADYTGRSFSFAADQDGKKMMWTFKKK